MGKIRTRTAAPVAVAALALTGATAAPALAAGGAVGTWSVADHGQGCWGGGTLEPGGSLGGSGGCAVHTPGGTEVASIVPETWVLNSDQTQALLCVDIVVKKGPPVISGQACFPVPVTSGAPANIPQISPDTYGKVTLTG
jgi:hypothetical protein